METRTSQSIAGKEPIQDDILKNESEIAKEIRMLQQKLGQCIDGIMELVVRLGPILKPGLGETNFADESEKEPVNEKRISPITVQLKSLFDSACSVSARISEVHDRLDI